MLPVTFNKENSMLGKSIIVMGVSASGKSTIGIKLALTLNAKFIDGDDLHPKNNIIKMAAGNPLNDKDRAPWLTRINDVAYSLECKNETGVIVCSSLKKIYREHIRQGNKNVTFVFLDGKKELILKRIQQRCGHFMKEEMINSQFEILERPDGEPRTIMININNPINTIIDQVVSKLANFNKVCK